MHIRLATESDVPAILTLIHALAVYEREPDAVQLGESELRRDGFGPRPLFECLIADDDGEADEERGVTGGAQSATEFRRRPAEVERVCQLDRLMGRRVHAHRTVAGAS